MSTRLQRSTILPVTAEVRGKAVEDSPRVHCAGLDTKKVFVILLLIVKTQKGLFPVIKFILRTLQ